jgi:ssDNA-binding Zn-finger/Zn-ribbon topoisomerase 1
MPIEETLCPKCGKRMVPRNSKHGKFWGCPDYPTCNGTRNADGEVPGGRDGAEE